MPKVFEKDGYRFSFYSNEHRPIHVHVRYGGGEAIFDVEKVGELSKAQLLAENNKETIIQKWHEFFN